MLVVHKSTPFKLSQIHRDANAWQDTAITKDSSCEEVSLTAMIHPDRILYTHNLILLLTILKVNNLTGVFWILYTQFCSFLNTFSQQAFLPLLYSASFLYIYFYSSCIISMHILPGAHIFSASSGLLLVPFDKRKLACVITL